jgi:hypothetical protein
MKKVKRKRIKAQPVKVYSTTNQNDKTQWNNQAINPKP